MSVLKKFNPYDLPGALVRVIATGRDAVLGEIVDTVAANIDAPIMQHLLIAAPRGFGKSFLLRLLQIELQERAKKGLPVRFVVLSEEQPNVTAPHLLLDEICRVLEGRPAGDVVAGWFDEEDAAWDQSLDRLRRTLEALPIGTKGLVVVAIENFDQLMATVFREDDDASRLRKLLASEGGRLMLLATATDRVDSAYGGRLFHALRTIELRPWDEDQCLTFFGRLRQELSRRELDQLERAKALAVAQFIGGSPRMATILYEVVQTHDSMQAIDLLDGLVDELTPYYKHRRESLSPRARALLDTLLRMGEPRSQSEVATKLGTTQNRVAQPFTELLGQQILIGERSARSRETLYRVTDRLMVHYYRKRIFLHGTGTSPLESITEFLESFFTEGEKRAEAERLRGLGFEAEAVLFERLIVKSRDVAGLPLLVEATQLDEALDQAMRHLTAGEPAAAVELALAAQQHAAVKGDRAGEAFAIMARAAALIGVDPEKSVIVAREAVAAIAKFGEGTMLSLPQYMLGASLFLANRIEEAAERLSVAAASARREKTVEVLLPCGMMLAQTLDKLERWNEAAAVWREMAELAGQKNDSSSQCTALNSWAADLTRQGQRTEAVEVYRNLANAAKASSDQHHEAIAAVRLSELLFSLEQFGEVSRWAESAIRLGEIINNSHIVMASTVFLAVSWIMTNNAVQAANLVRTYLDQARDEIDRKSTPLLNLILTIALTVSIRTGKGDIETLSNQAERAHEEDDPQSQAFALAALCIVHRGSGDYHKSIDSLARMMDLIGNLSIDVLPEFGSLMDAAIDRGAYSAVRGGRWPELWQRLAGIPPTPELSIRISASVASAITDEAHEQGRSDAFAAVAAVIDFLAEEATRKAPPHPRLDAFAILRRTTADLAGRLQDAGLLRDIATHLAHSLPTDTAAEQALLTAAALYIEGGGADSALERVDPDIAAAIKRTRGKRDAKDVAR
jgi:tetratricopeptide (TPR) repeat protein